MVDEALVTRLSELCNVEIDAAERSQLAADLGRIIGYVQLLEHADLDTPEVVTKADAKAPRGRPDEPSPSLDRDLVLAQAPRTDAGGFAVPAFVDEG
jgi:aspartyl-tRNA(Asn)/glutamyl-tRNA(Gln) amidotransferase subunit C